MPDTETLTEEQLKEIEARRADASSRYCVNWEKGSHALLQEGGWRPLSEEQPRTIATFDREHGYPDLLFCAEAHNDIPALCRSLRAAWADVEDLSQRLIESADRRGEIVTRLAQHEEVNRQLMKDLGRATDECRRLQDERDALRTQNQTQAESIIEFQKQLKEAHANVESLSQIIFRSEHAVAMRDACVEKVKSMRDEWQIQADARRDPDAPHDYKGSYGLASGAVDACDDIIEALESLTLDEVQEKR